jgi:hypothetical protein
MAKKPVNIHEAIHIIHDTVYNQAVVEGNAAVLMKQRIFNTNEKDELLSLKNRLQQIEFNAEKKLLLKPDTSIDQNTINAIQSEKLKQVRDRVFEQVTTTLSEVSLKLKKEHSKEFIDCLLRVKEQLVSLQHLMQELQFEDTTLYKKYTSEGNLFELCREIGAVYVPISQAFDPFIGGLIDTTKQFKGKDIENWTDEEISQLSSGDRQQFDEISKSNYKVMPSSGQCGGMVLSWIFDNTKVEPIRYPYYAKEWHSYNQKSQQSLKTDFYQTTKANINDVTRDYIKRVKENKLYYLAMGNKDSAHAIGIKKRQDGVYEIFDPNYFHVFCPTEDSAQQTLNYLMGNYIKDFGFSWAESYEYKIDSLAISNHFPGKIALMSAAARKKQGGSEQKLLELIKDRVVELSSAFKENKSVDKPLYLKSIENTVQSLLENFNDDEKLSELNDYFTKCIVENNLISHSDDVKQVLQCIEDRHQLIIQPQFKQEVMARAKVAQQYLAIEEKLKSEMVDVKEKMTQIRKDETKGGSDKVIIESNLSYLRAMSMNLFKKYNALQNTNIAKTIILEPIKGLVNKTKFASRNAVAKLKNVFGMSKKEDRPILEFSNEASSRDEKEFVDEFDGLVKEIETKIESDISETHVEIEALQHSPILQKRNDLSNRVDRALLGLEAVCHDIDVVSDMNHPCFALLVLAQQQPSLRVLSSYKELFKGKAKDMKRNLVSIRNELIQSYEGEQTVDGKALEKVDNLEIQFYQVMQLDTIQSKMIADESISKNKLSAIVAEMVQKNIHLDDEILPLLSENTGKLTSTIDKDKFTLLNSLDTLIHLVENHKQEQIQSMEKITLSDVDDFENLLVVRKRDKEIGKIDSKLKQLMAYKNQLIYAEGKSFYAIANEVQSTYETCFPQGFSLPKDYADKVLPMLNINKVFVLTDNDRKIIEKLKRFDDKLSQAIAVIEEKMRSYPQGEKVSADLTNKHEILKYGYKEGHARYGMTLKKLSSQLTNARKIMMTMDIELIEQWYGTSQDDENQGELSFEHQLAVTLLKPDLDWNDDVFSQTIFRKNYWSDVKEGPLLEINKADVTFHEILENQRLLSFKPGNNSLVPKDALENQYRIIKLVLDEIVKVKNGSWGISESYMKKLYDYFPSLYLHDGEINAMRLDMLAHVIDKEGSDAKLKKTIGQLVESLKFLLDNNCIFLDKKLIDSLRNHVQKRDASVREQLSFIYSIHQMLPELMTEHLEVTPHFYQLLEQAVKIELNQQQVTNAQDKRFHHLKIDKKNHLEKFQELLTDVADRMQWMHENSKKDSDMIPFWMNRPAYSSSSSDLKKEQSSIDVGKVIMPQALNDNTNENEPDELKSSHSANPNRLFQKAPVTRRLKGDFAAKLNSLLDKGPITDSRPEK